MSILVRGVRAWGVSVGWGCLILEHWHSPRPPLLWIFIVILVRSWLSCRRKLRLGATSSAPAPRQQVRRSQESWWHAAEGRHRHSWESSWSGLVTRDTWHSASHMTVQWDSSVTRGRVAQTGALLTENTLVPGYGARHVGTVGIGWRTNDIKLEATMVFEAPL